VVISNYTDYAGIVTRFGGVGKTIVTRNLGITGPTGPGIGWFLQLHKGAPSSFAITTARVPWVPEISAYTYLPFAMPYPRNLAASNFQITLRSFWNTKTYANVTAAGTLSEAWSDPGGRKFFYEPSTGLLYFKLMAEWVISSTSGVPLTNTTLLADKNYSSGGCRLYDGSVTTYDIKLLSCSGCTILSSSGGTTYYSPYTATAPAKSVLPW
jgi:hypothetical protein